MISTEQVKELRDKTGVSIMQCRKALEEANGDIEKALLILKKKGADIAANKGHRTLGAGAIQSYIHANGTVGAIVELSSETDFVAKNEEFKKAAYDIAMHVAATNPEFLSMDDISAEAKTKAEEAFVHEVDGKPEEMKRKILDGKLNSYFSERVLLEQPFIKNPDVTIKELVNSLIQKFGEKTEIRRFVRFSTGD
ncbi:MAG: elongation factor Ts [Minisyncoccia bacterium]